MLPVHAQRFYFYSSARIRLVGAIRAGNNIVNENTHAQTQLHESVSSIHVHTIANVHCKTAIYKHGRTVTASETACNGWRGSFAAFAFFKVITDQIYLYGIGPFHHFSRANARRLRVHGLLCVVNVRRGTAARVLTSTVKAFHGDRPQYACPHPAKYSSEQRKWKHTARV